MAWATTMKFEPTPEQHDIAVRAAAVYGAHDKFSAGQKERPRSFSSVIDEAVPSYACRRKGKNVVGEPAWFTNETPCTDRDAIRLWHDLAAYALTLVPGLTPATKPKCARAGCEQLVKTVKRKFCSGECSQLVRRHALPQCANPACSNHVKHSSASYCCQRCHQDVMLGTVVEQSCGKCGETFMRAWSASTKRCPDCR